jgi:hypothetical protein
VIGFFQAMTEEKSPNASKKDFRIGPKTLTALLDSNNTLTYTQKTKIGTQPKEKLEPMPKSDTDMNIIQNTTTDENMETRPIITPEEKLEPMPKSDTDMNITQNTTTDENMETRPIITPKEVETKENKEIQINDYFDPITDWTDKIAPRVKSENMGNRMVKETARNRTDKERNKDSEKFIENWVKEDSIIIDI